MTECSFVTKHSVEFSNPLVTDGEPLVTPRLPLKKTSPPAPPTVSAALFLCLICGGGFFGLLSMVFPGAGMLGLTLIVLGLLFVAQYLVWGKWLYAYVVRKEQEAEAAEQAKRGESGHEP
jgi:hypothetical protein